jgi:hypothetical protein
MLFVKILVLVGSISSIGFGLWHLFVPSLWKWYSYFDTGAKELVLAVRATNVFFSLSLVLFGIINLLLVYAGKSNKFSIIVVLAATSILWITRVVMQLVYPQGSMNPVLQHGMLIAFIVIPLCYLVSIIIMGSQKSVV